MKTEIEITDRLNLTEAEREALERKEARNTLIKAGVGVATVVVSFLVSRQLDRQLVDEFTTEEPTEIE